MILYFENSLGQRREIGQGKSEQEIFQIINKFLEEHNYTRDEVKEGAQSLADRKGLGVLE